MPSLQLIAAVEQTQNGKLSAAVGIQKQLNHCIGASWFVFSLVRNLMTANEYYLTPTHDRYADLAQGEGGAVIFPRGPINGGQYDEVCPRSTDLVHTWRSLIFTAEKLDGWKNASYIGESQNCYKHQISEILRN